MSQEEIDSLLMHGSYDVLKDYNSLEDQFTAENMH